MALQVQRHCLEGEVRRVQKHQGHENPGTDAGGWREVGVCLFPVHVLNVFYSESVGGSNIMTHLSSRMIPTVSVTIVLHDSDD